MISERQYRLGLRRRIAAVPDSPYLREYLSSIAGPDLSSTILVEIPAYRDPELFRTIRAATEMAANPDRIRFAICLQDDELTLHMLERVPNCRIKYFPASAAPGTCAARYWCQSLYDGEDFVYHMDAHMRFAFYWDVGMIEMWRRCRDDMGILTDMTLDFRQAWADLPVSSGTFDCEAAMYGVPLSAMLFAYHTCDLRCTIGRRFSGDPRLGAFRNAGNTFGRGFMDETVRFDPNMDFRGDEHAMTPRYWTHGFNFYHAPVRFVYHMWRRPGASGSDPGVVALRNTAGADGLSRWEREMRRLETLFGYHAWPGIDMSGYEFGTVRSFDAYQAFSGIDFNARTIRRFAADGSFGREHGPDDMRFFDWMSAYKDHWLVLAARL